MPVALGMSYTKEGKGKEILLLHGWGSKKESFYYQIQYLKQFFTVIAVDFWGFGESKKLFKPFTVLDYAQKLDCFLEYIGIHPYAVIAHSFGARVLLKAGFDCTKIVITGGAGVRPKRKISYYIKIAVYKVLKKIKFFGSKKLKNKFGSSDFKQLGTIMRNTFINIVNEDLTGYLKDIDSQTLLVWGDNDTETPLYMGSIMKNSIPNSKLVIMQNCGHCAFIDDFMTFNKIIGEFLLDRRTTFV